MSSRLMLPEELVRDALLVTEYVIHHDVMLADTDPVKKAASRFSEHFEKNEKFKTVRGAVQREIEGCLG